MPPSSRSQNELHQLSEEDQRLALDELCKELRKRIKRRLDHLVSTNMVGFVEVKVDFDELGVAVTAQISGHNRLEQIRVLHLKFRKAIAAEFKPFLDAGGKMPDISIVMYT